MLIEQFADHSATRRYEALVWGVPDAPHGIIDGPIGRDRGDPLKMAVVANGRYARTDYRVIGSYSAPAVVSRLECRLETGRTHQIRVHLASIKHPLVGDPTYSQRRPMLGLTRPFLHAAELAFVHPTTGERVTFHSPLAADLQAWLDAATPWTGIHRAMQFDGDRLERRGARFADAVQGNEHVGLRVVGRARPRRCGIGDDPEAARPCAASRRRRSSAGRRHHRRASPRAVRSSSLTNTTRRPPLDARDTGRRGRRSSCCTGRGCARSAGAACPPVPRRTSTRSR